MPDENEQVALEDSENEEKVTADAGASIETTPALEDAAHDEGEANAAESENTASTDPEAKQRDSAINEVSAPPASRTSRMAGIGGAMLVLSLIHI